MTITAIDVEKKREKKTKIINNQIRINIHNEIVHSTFVLVLNYNDNNNYYYSH